MGVINITPDSFHPESRHQTIDSAIQKGLELEKYGADILDIGGESTRPGSDPVDSDTEQKRIIPVIETLSKNTQVPISVDTYKASVAKMALMAGASMVNDISALTADTAMGDLIRDTGVPVVLMHMKGDPKTMQHNPVYKNVVREIGDYLLSRALVAEKNGISPENIILDPGIGFGKRLEDNLLLIKGFSVYINNRYPVLIGHSRKRFIGSILGEPETTNRLYGSLGAAAAAIFYGATFLRVHDVKETREMAKVLVAIQKE